MRWSYVYLYLSELLNSPLAFSSNSLSRLPTSPNFKKVKEKMTIHKTLLASIIIALLIIGSTVDGYDNAKEGDALRSKISTLELSNAEEAEKKIQELKLSFEQLQRINDEQKRALELAEKELKRTKLEASSRFGKLTMNLAVSFWKEHAKPSIISLMNKTTEKMVHVKEWSVPHIGPAKNKETNRTTLESSSKFGKLTMNLAVSFWKEHAKPSVIALMNKTTEKMVHVKEWSVPHIGSAKNKWVPAAKQQFENFLISIVPYMKDLSTKTIEVYKVSKSTMKPHLDREQERALSYYKKWACAAKQQFEIFMIDMVPYMKTLPTKTIEVYDVSKSAMEPHFNKVQEMALSYYKKWVPAAKQQFEVFMINFEPYLKKLSTKTIEVYEASKKTMKPHFDKVQELALSYFKEVWSYLKPYTDQLFIVTEPYVEKLQILLKPLTKYAALMHRKLPTRESTYHHQVKSTIEEHPRKHELTWAYPTTKLLSVMAYVLLAFSVPFLCRFLESIFFTKKRKQLKRISHASESQRRPKRRRAEN